MGMIQHKFHIEIQSGKNSKNSKEIERLFKICLKKWGYSGDGDKMLVTYKVEIIKPHWGLNSRPWVI